MNVRVDTLLSRNGWVTTFVTIVFTFAAAVAVLGIMSSEAFQKDTQRLDRFIGED